MRSPSSLMLPETPATGTPSCSSSRYDSPPSSAERGDQPVAGRDRDAPGERLARGRRDDHVPGARRQRQAAAEGAGRIGDHGRPASGADGATGLSLTAAPAASVTEKVGVGAVTSAAVSTIASPGAAVPETATAPVMVASASGWSSVTATPPTGSGSAPPRSPRSRARTTLLEGRSVTGSMASEVDLVRSG